jgi:transposase
MSTRSELYHCFGLGTVELLRTDFVGGTTVFHCRHERKRLLCACCHGGRVIRRRTVSRRFRLVPVGCHPTWLEFDIQRLECRDCGTVRQERLTFASPRKRYTRAFARYVLELSHIGMIRDVARHVGVGRDLVAEIQREQMEKEVRKTELSTVTRIALDELAIGKGQRYVIIVLDLDTGAAIHVAEGRSSDSVTPFLRQLKRSGATIKALWQSPIDQGLCPLPLAPGPRAGCTGSPLPATAGPYRDAASPRRPANSDGRDYLASLTRRKPKSEYRSDGEYQLRNAERQRQDE